MNKKIKIILVIIFFSVVVSFSYFIYIFNLDFRIIQQASRELGFNEYGRSDYLLINNIWKGNKLIVNTKIKTNCKGVEIFGDYNITNDNLELVYYEKKEKSISKSICLKDFQFILRFKEQKNYKINLISRNDVANRKDCRKAGGNWKIFKSPCADNCFRGLADCLSGFSWGCDCGDGECFEDGNCINNPEYLKESVVNSKDVMIDDYQRKCQNDDDCVLFQADCGDCSFDVINKDYLNVYREIKKENCRNIENLIACDIVLNGKIKCINKKCVIR